MIIIPDNRNQYQHLLIFVSLWHALFLLWAVSSTEAADDQSKAAERYSLAAAAVSTAIVSQRLEDIDAARKMLNRLPEPGDPTTTNSLNVNTSLSLWIRLLNGTAAAVDPKFDSSDRPVARPAPPLPYNSGISPEAIPDPVARKKYEEALHSNEMKRQAFDFQLRIQNMRKSLLGEVKNFLHNTLSSKRSTKDALQEQILKKVKDETDRKELLQKIGEF